MAYTFKNSKNKSNIDDYHAIELSFNMDVVSILFWITSVVIAFLIFSWQNKTSLKLANLTTEIHDMTSVYRNIQSNRIISFTKGVCNNLIEIKEIYTNLLELMKKYNNNKSAQNRKELVNYFSNDYKYFEIMAPKHFIGLCIRDISRALDISKDFIMNTGLLKELELSVPQLATDFKAINRLIEEENIDSSSFRIHIRSVERQIKMIDKYISEIESEEKHLSTDKNDSDMSSNYKMNNPNTELKSISLGLIVLIGFIVIIYSILIEIIGKSLASMVDTVFIGAIIGSFTLVGTIVAGLFLKK